MSLGRQVGFLVVFAALLVGPICLLALDRGGPPAGANFVSFPSPSGQHVVDIYAFRGGGAASTSSCGVSLRREKAEFEDGVVIAHSREWPAVQPVWLSDTHLELRLEEAASSLHLSFTRVEGVTITLR